MPPKKATATTTTTARPTRTAAAAKEAPAAVVEKAPAAKVTKTKAVAEKKVVEEAKPVEEVKPTVKKTATKVAPKQVSEPEPKVVKAKSAPAEAKKAPVAEPVVEQKPKKASRAPVDIEQMKIDHQNYFATLDDAQMVKEFTKIRRDLGIAGFDRALKKIQKVGGIQGNAVHKENKAQDKKGKEYETYVRMRAAPHKYGGVVYIGHLPPGFTEKPMKKFFAQFGEVKRIQLSRSKKSGAYRGWGFVEFSDKQVAAIVAESMDKYMLYGRTLQCQYIPYDQLHAETFRNNFRDFKKIDFTRIHNDKVNQMRDDDSITKMNQNTTKSLSKKAQKLAAMGWSMDDVIVDNGQELPEITQPTKKTKSAVAAVEDKKVQLPKESVKAVKASVTANKAAAAKVVAAQEESSSESEPEPAPKKRGRPAAAAAAAPKVQVEEVKAKAPAKKVTAKKTK